MLLTMFISLTIGFQSAARHVVEAATRDACLQQFIEGVTIYMEATGGMRLMLAICGVGLFAVAVIRRDTKS
jgi:myo-inositol-hexaphosphate 3-phosphohydrolase